MNRTYMTDHYQMTMARAYSVTPEMRGLHACFDYFFRRLPIGWEYLITCGLQQVLDYVKEFSMPEVGVDRLRVTVQSVPEGREVSCYEPIVRLAALLHDVGKPSTASDGHFIGHEVVGATLAEAFVRRLRMPRAVGERVRHLVRHHMFSYEPGWSDAAVRRFIGKICEPALDELFALREADNVGSGLPAQTPDLAALRRRVEAQLDARVALDRADLAIDGDDLIRELGMTPGPGIGRVLDRLLERVILEPALNDRPTLLALAHTLRTEKG